MYAPSSGAPFRKRTFSLLQYARCLAALMTASPVLVRALSRPRISPALREQIMLAVTSVNDCRYCNWGHTALALRNSVDLTALRQTLDSGSLSADSTPDEVAICTPSMSPAGRVMLTRARGGRLRVPGLRMSRPRSRLTSRRYLREPRGQQRRRLARAAAESASRRRASGRGGDRGPGRFPGAPVSLGVEPHAGIRGDRLAVSSSRHSLRQPE